MRAVCHQKWWTHFDEVFALWLIEKYGQHRYPGVTMDDVLIYGMDVSQPRKDILFIGVGRGQFDDHTSHGKTKGKSAAALIAEELQLLDRYPELAVLVEYGNRVDIHGVSGIQEIGSVLLGIEDREQAIAWARFTLDVVVDQWRRKHFDPMAIAAYESAHCYRANNHVVVVADPMPDEVQSISALAFADKALRVDVVVQRRRSGQCAITANKKTGRDLARVFEKLDKLEPDRWHAEGNGKIRLVLNGGHTHPEITPTKLSTETIVKIILEALC